MTFVAIDPLRKKEMTRRYFQPSNSILSMPLIADKMYCHYINIILYIYVLPNKCHSMTKNLLYVCIDSSYFSLTEFISHFSFIFESNMYHLCTYVRYMYLLTLVLLNTNISSSLENSVDPDHLA